MKTIDHAFLRAFNRDRDQRPRTSRERALLAQANLGVAGRSSTGTPGDERRAPATASLEEIYSEGGWYRIDTPVGGAAETVAPPRKTPTSWYDPPWAERVTVEPIAELTSADTASYPSAPVAASRPAPIPIAAPQTAPWDVASFVVMPGVAEQPSPASSPADQPNSPTPVDNLMAAAGKLRPANRKLPISKLPISKLPVTKLPLRQPPVASPLVDRLHAEKLASPSAPASSPTSFAELGTSSAANSIDSTVVLSNKWAPPPETRGEERDAPEPAVAELPAPEPAPSDKTKFAAAWEVTRFRWPTVCDQLDETDCLRDVGEKLKSATAGGMRILATVASQPDEGCTTVCLSLARSAACAGLRIAILDANLADPQLAVMLGVEPTIGWDEAIDQGLPTTESALTSLLDGVTIFPRKLETPAAVNLSDDRVGELLRELTRSFDLVIVDVGQLPASTTQFVRRDAKGKSVIDAAAIVQDVRKSTAEHVQLTASRLRSLGIDKVAIAENFGKANAGG